MQTLISIIMPIWNEESKIFNDLEHLNAFSKSFQKPIEIIITDDGSTDNSISIIKAYSAGNFLNIKPIVLEKHIGKGYALRKGIENATGKYVLIMDSGATIPMKYISIGLELLSKENIDLLIGSRHLPNSKIKQNLIWYRKISSLLFRSLIKYIFDLKIKDTQCGFKFLVSDTAQLLIKECNIDGFLFDLELILLARQKKLKFREFAIIWNCDRDSRLSIFKIFFPLIKDLAKLKKRFKD